jgi:hypothetical protein
MIASTSSSARLRYDREGIAGPIKVPSGRLPSRIAENIWWSVHLPMPVSGSGVMLGVAAVKSACLMMSPPASFLSAKGPFGPFGV